MGFTKGQKVYISSSDRRQTGFDAIVTSVGSKYITVTTNYNRKYKFSKHTLICEEWSIYTIEESEEQYKKRMEKEHKLRIITRNGLFLGKILSDAEIDDICNRIIQLCGIANV